MLDDSTPSKPDVASVRAKVRAKLEYPKGAREVLEGGEVRYLKPPLGTLLNLELVLGQDPDFYPLLGHNTFTDEVTWHGVPITDERETLLNLQIQRYYRLSVATERVREVMMVICREHPYHPVREWLERLGWDGVPRMGSLLAKYAGADDTPLNTAISRKWMLSALARIMDPGCKVDTMMILVGIQGALKSTFFQALCHDKAWFADTAIDIGDKDAFMALGGIWVYEIGELTALQGREAEHVKAFLSSQSDRFRPPYGRNMVRRPRQGVFVGSTNSAEFLDDPTGSRRFWPVGCGGVVDVAGVERDHAQLWAEAMEARQAGERWWFDAQEEKGLSAARDEYQRCDPWEESIREWLAKQMSSVTIRDVLNDALGVQVQDQSMAMVRRSAAIVAAAGWKKKRAMLDGVQAWRWERA